MNFFRRIFRQVTDSNIGKTVVRFRTRGCMAQDHEFDYIGKILFLDAGGAYVVEVLKSGSFEKRDGNLKYEYERVFPSYLQNIGGDFLVAYD
jgi:hypothetical protein